MTGCSRPVSLTSLAPLCRSWRGAFMPILRWLLYADHRVASLCRSRNGSIWAIINSGSGRYQKGRGKHGIAVVAIGALISVGAVRHQAQNGLSGDLGIQPTSSLPNPAPQRKTALLSESRVFIGRPCGIRTCDQRIKSPLLYQLSFLEIKDL